MLPPNGVLLSPAKPEGSHPLVIDGPFARPTALRLHVLTVSSAARLVVEAGGKQILDKQFKCGPGSGEWKRAEFKPQWQIYQNLFDRDYPCSIPAGTRQVRIRVAEGDWLEIGQIGLKPADAAKETVVDFKQEFGKPPEPFRFAPGVPGGPIFGLPMQDRAWLWKQCIEPWKEAERQGIGVMVGEWGVFNQHAARRRAPLGRGLPGQLAEGRLGLGDVELPRIDGRPGQRPQRHPLRGFRGPQARPQAHGSVAAVLRTALHDLSLPAMLPVLRAPRSPLYSW